MTSFLSQTWLGPRLLLLCLLVSGSITQEELKHCSHMIGDGHLQLLQQLVSARPCLPISPLGKLRQKPGNRVQERGGGQRSRTVQHMARGPYLAPMMLLLLAFCKSGRLTHSPPNSEALTGSPAGRRQSGLLAGCRGG